jgi:hypothetical protein
MINNTLEETFSIDDKHTVRGDDETNVASNQPTKSGGFRLISVTRNHIGICRG